MTTCVSPESKDIISQKLEELSSQLNRRSEPDDELNAHLVQLGAKQKLIQLGTRTQLDTLQLYYGAYLEQQEKARQSDEICYSDKVLLLANRKVNVNDKVQSCQEVLNRYTPEQQKIIRVGSNKYLNKVFYEAIEREAQLKTQERNKTRHPFTTCGGVRG